MFKKIYINLILLMSDEINSSNNHNLTFLNKKKKRSRLGNKFQRDLDLNKIKDKIFEDYYDTDYHYQPFK